MAIFDIRIIDERYETLEHFQSGGGEVFSSLIAKSYGDLKYPFLNSIDEYGNTFFTKLQIPHLINEIRTITSEQYVNQLNTRIEDVITYLNKVDQFTYVHFMGE